MNHNSTNVKLIYVITIYLIVVTKYKNYKKNDFI